MLKRLRIIPLIVGLVIGVIAVLFIKPQMTVVYKYPTPDTAGKVVYKDKNGVCYKYIATKADCDKNESRLKDFPLNK
jgi:hypothetical protein|uniref:Uncharacterized protein n=1 Tax=viral metagenome TaxID=1070528 RepID=A0A6C0DW84_9ZZZZ